MKFRRGIAKLLVAVTIVELVLSSINRNEYMVMAATDDGTQSEAIVEESVDNVEDSATDSTQNASTEVVETVGEDGESATGDNTESTVGDNSESTTQETTENTTQETTESTTENTTESTTESTTEDTSKNAAEDGTEDEVQSTTTDASESTTEKVTENTVKSLTSGVIEAIVNSVSASADEQAEEEAADGDGIAPLSEEEETIELGTSTIPTTEEGLSQTTFTYTISSYQDWLNLQELSQVSTLDGYTFEIHPLSVNGKTTDHYYFTDLNEYLSSKNAAQFVGLGSENTPFAGKMYAKYDSGIKLHTNVPLFAYLSTGAELDFMEIESQGAKAGLADYLIVDEDHLKFSQLERITIKANESGITGNIAGGLFANVENKTGSPFELKGEAVVFDASVSVSGSEVAGGIIGAMEGSITMVMDGGIQSAPYVEATSTNGTTGTIGGWIGTIDAANGDDKGTIRIQSGSDDAKIDYTFQGKRSNTARIAGGLFGKISNAIVSVESKLTINKSSLEPTQEETKNGVKYFDLSGITAGSFAGEVDNSTINLKANAEVNQVRIKLGNNKSITTGKGIGGFVGVVQKSVIDSETSDGSLQILSVNVVNELGEVHHNVGGITGYAKNTYFKFSNADCTINDFTTSYTHGNVGGAIGLYEADSTMNETIIQRISVTGTTTVYGQRSGGGTYGNAGGLIGKMLLEDCDVKVEKCYGGENIYYSGKNISLGIGYVSSNETSAKLQLSEIVLKGILGSAPNTYTGNATATYGGMIGYADIDLVIDGKEKDGVKEVTNAETGEETEENVTGFDTAVCYLFLEKEQKFANLGGLVGVLAQSGEKYREADISNVLVGTHYYRYFGRSQVYGGLLAKVEDRTSVCLDKKIYMDGGNAISWNSTEAIVVSAQNNEQGTSCYGSVVGSQNYSLIYLQPTGDLQLSSKYQTDEIGNYGGVFRNGDWDTENIDVNGNIVLGGNENESNWLIQNHKVTGAWKGESSDSGAYKKFKLETVGDFMRLAIFGNTYNDTGDSNTEYKKGDGFYPTTTESGATVTYKDIVQADFYVTPGKTYDLRGTGIVSLYRNDSARTDGASDNESVYRNATSKTKNSLICEDEANEATIKYEIKNYSHQYIGLFPCVNGYIDGQTSKTVLFKNLKLDYTYSFEKIYYCDKQYVSEKYNSQYVGGLAGKTENNIEVSNVSYVGNVDDNRNPGDNERYTGGLLGVYIGADGTALSIKNVGDEQKSTSFICTSQHYKNVIGGVVAKIDAPWSGSCDVTLEQIYLEGSIKAEYTNGADLQQSALVTYIRDRSSNGIFVNMKISDVAINGFSLTAQDVTVSHPIMGGFLGYRWNCVNVDLNSVEIGTSGEAKLCAKANFGGLVHDVKGKMTISDMKYGSYTIFDANGGGSQCGLLVRNGENLYLDVISYDIDEYVRLCNYVDIFDELVGYNQDGINENRGGIVTIRNLDSAGNSCLQKGNGYYSYGNGYHIQGEVVSFLYQMQNYQTRYYYDLHKLDFAEKFLNLTTIDSPEKLMVWHLMHYANDYIVNYCMFDGQKDYVNEIPSEYTITGTIDMTGYSIYPTTLTKYESFKATTGAKIIFNAQAINDGENYLNNNKLSFVQKYPENYMSQHYQMHAGLFGDLTAGVKVDGLTLTGTYSYTYIEDEKGDTYFAGALVSGSIYGIKDGTDSEGNQLYKENVKYEFNNINLDDLWCVSAQGKLQSTTTGAVSAQDFENPIGLMIYRIESGAKVDLNGIRMSNYKEQDVTNGYKAASALIGWVGDENATYINISFKNMDIMDAANGLSSAELNSSKDEEALAKASFIYYFDYKENCSAIYTFTSEDYLVGKLKAPKLETYTDYGVVTLGQELGNQVYEDYNNKQYAQILYYDNDYPVGYKCDRLDADGEATTEAISEIAFGCNNYLPYVCVQRQMILVNPKIANIEEGCGTYEDPYIISSANQMITIYRYLYEEDLYKEILGMSGNEWKMHATGNDDNLCNRTDDSSLGHGSLIKYEKVRSEGSKFPTKEQLSQAYYMITEDIDLSQFSEFIGFGRDEMPFIGVFVGQMKETADESYSPTITMLEQSTDSSSSLSSYAFINTAKGVVVKDLNILFKSAVGIDDDGIAAGVIATVAGGDNIIDNVTVSSSEGVNCFSVIEGVAVVKKDTVAIGGYVGVVELGGVILRNMDASDLADFSVSIASKTATDISEYPYIGSVIGRVLDGYVVYESLWGSNTEPLFKNMTVGKNLILTNNTLPLCSTYDIINGQYLSTTGSKIQWTGSGFKIADNKQLLIISMALNSGMLNYGEEDNNGDTYGYGSDSRQRNGDYGYVGYSEQSNNDFRTCYQDIISGDNKDTFADSYLWQYFEDASTDKNMVDLANKSGLNPITIDGSVSNVTDAETGVVKTVETIKNMLTYTLTGSYYDMSVFGMGFRGLGARYHCDEYTQKNNSSTYLVDTTLLFKSNLVGVDEMSPATIKLDMIVTRAMDSRRAGLLNEAPNNSTWHAWEMLIQNIKLTGQVKNEGLKISKNWNTYYEPDVCYNAGGFMSDSVTQTKFVNVKLEDLTVEATSYAGGLIGHVKEVFTSNVTAQVIDMDGVTVIGGWDCDEEENKLTGGIINGHAGGLIGLFESGNGTKGGSCIRIGTNDGTNDGNLKGVDGNMVTVYTRGRNSAAGGLVGEVYMHTQAIDNPCCFYNVNFRNLYVYTANTYLAMNLNWDMYIRGWAGGIVGHARQAKLNLDKITIGSKTQSENVFIALGDKNTKGSPISVHYQSEDLICSGVGGFVGQSYANGTYLNITNSSIEGTCDESGNGNTTIQGFSNVGGMIGSADTGMVQNCTIKGVSLISVSRAGGCVGTGSGAFELNQVKVSECNLKSANPNSGDYEKANGGYLGGLVARITNNSAKSVIITDCEVSDCVISPDYSRYAGGYIGYIDKQQSVSISGTNNTVSRNVICGDVAGGIFGYYCTTGVGTGMSNITVSDNKIVSCSQNLSNVTQSYLAGGFAGLIITSSEVGPIENLIIKNNIISGFNTLASGYDSQNCVSAGGVVGKSNANTYFYDVELNNNYIGVFEDKNFLTKVREQWNNGIDSSATDAVKIPYYLDKENISNLATMLYAKTASYAQDTRLVSVNDGLQELASVDLYKYSYELGAVAGKLANQANGRVNTFVELNIQYNNNAFRPVSDVGMIDQTRPQSTAEMYKNYRTEYDIVYDSMNTESQFDNDDAKYAGFANLETIYDAYQNTDVDRRYAYRLDQNYLEGSNSDRSIKAIYEETYHNGENYISDFKTENGNILPLVVFRTADYATLDDVVQTYINMLTNNSGALNTYDQQDIQVTTTRQRLVGGVIIDDTTSTPASVQVIENGNKFEFVNTIDEDGDGEREKRLYDSMTDANNVTFTLITISYMYGDEAKWVLEIPVYVEQELEFDSHLRFVKDLEYDVSKVKLGFSIDPASEYSTNLDSAGSYTLYLEYVYGEARTRYPNAKIPKQLKIESITGTISFLTGTQMTLIDLANGGTPYYYTVDGTEGNIIDFTKFIASDGVSNYSVKNINECKEYVTDPYTNVCGMEKTNVAVESYLLLVDTSNVDQTIKNNRGSALYTLRTDISQLENTDPRLYSRIEYTEHCLVRINETPGISCNFTENCDTAGQISEGQSLTFSLEYDVTLSSTWVTSNKDTPMYLDIAVSLQKTENNNSQDISLPVGTQVYFAEPVFNEINSETVYKRLDTVYVVQGEGNSNVYYYANSGQEINVFDNTIFSTDENADNKKKIQIIFDFSTADLSAFEGGGDYGISADLILSTDAKREVRDTVFRTVNADVATEIGFALQTDDLLYQGVNRYQSGETDTGLISFKARVALPSDYEQKDLAGKYFSFVYKIEEKTARRISTEAPVYTPYTGNDIRIYYPGEVEADLADLDTLTPYTDKTATPKIKYQYCSLSYDTEEISVKDNIAEASFILEADEDLDYSNYRVTGYLVISDDEIGSLKTVLTGIDELNSDFFVYTVAKVKTDLNIDWDAE